jgi:integral membrane protein
MLGILRLIGLVEGISYLLLLGVCMPLKYMFDMPEYTRPVGMAHGVLFVGYCILVLIVAFQKKWSFVTVFWALLASLLPFGTFVADKKIFRD